MASNQSHLKILTGLFDHMVLQRDAKGHSDALITGMATADGTLVATVSAGGRKLKGLAGLKLGAVKAGGFSARLRGVPAGGPYDVELAVLDARGTAVGAAKVKDVLVGDVWILGGQSNMQGVGDKENGLRPDPLVRAFFMDDHWGQAWEPVHDLSSAVDPVHPRLCGGANVKPGRYCAGPGLSFALEMRRRLGVPQGLIACAHGGTSMSQWDPAKKTEGGDSLYGAMLRRFVKNGSKVAGLVWYQGCSDANPDAAARFTGRMKAFVAACRRDFHHKDMPFVQVQISRVVGWDASGAAAWNSIQDQQRYLPEQIRRCMTVPAIDLALDDVIHISGAGQALLGRRLAEAMDTLLRGRVAGKPPIGLGRISVETDPGHVTSNLVVEFENVAGRLVAAGVGPPAFQSSTTRATTACTT